MNKFATGLKSQLNQQKTLTENGALAYESSGHALLDFNFATTGLREQSEEYIANMYQAAFYEDPHVGVKYLFFLRDCREGMGERRTFITCMQWLVENRPAVVKALLPLFPEYGRWKDLWPFLDTPLKQDVIDLVGVQLDKDYEALKEGKPISLLVKWLPSCVASSRETKRYAGIFIDAWGITPARYRKKISAMRKTLDLVESKMSAQKWGEINYSAVPSRANLIYGKAFMRHDEERRATYLQSLTKGETKINAGVLQPHEIVNSYINYGYSWYRPNINAYDETLEQLWKALPQMGIGDTLVVCDTSSSMCEPGYRTKVRPFDVAIALSVYTSEHNSDDWKNLVLSFSNRPKFFDLSNCNSLREKIEYFFKHSEVADTDIEKTMDLILQTAISNGYKQDEMPSRVIILSDMQFNQAVYAPSRINTIFESISRKYQMHGYKLPRIIFWNLSGEVDKTMPMQKNENGLVLCSGFSVQLLRMVMSDRMDPYDVLLDTINSPRYDAVDAALKGII